MSAMGDVVFRRGEDDEDCDIWDDSALIKAYDNAVTVMKTRLNPERDTEDADDNVENDSVQKKGKKKKRKKRKDKQLSSSEWKKGDRCYGVYSEDGIVYEAVIQKINYKDGTCTVRYCGYGNEEEQALSELLRLDHTSRPASRMTSDLGSEAESMDWMRGERPRSRNVPSTCTDTHHQRPHSSAGRGSAPPTPSNIPPYPGSWPPFMGNMPFAPPMYPSMPMPTVPGWPSGHCSNRYPYMPPPPPIDDDAITDDKEALHSMLIAWYMSGYHTGFYQGLKQGRDLPHQHSEEHRNKDSAGARR